MRVAKIHEVLEQVSPSLKSLAMFIGNHPELNFNEFLAQAKLVSFLKQHHFKIQKGVGGLPTAFVGSFGRGRPHIGYLAEYDALPGIGHACGHNLIGTASCGAAVALAKCLEGKSGTVFVMGCPAEEGGGGKVILSQKGLFKRLDCAMMAHPDSKTEVIKFMLALMEIDIEFFGKQAHAAAEPEKGINALDAAAATYVRILKFRKTLKKDARVHGVFAHAGVKPNIIPEYASLKYYVRSLQMADVKMIVDQMTRIAKEEAQKQKATIHITQNPLPYEPFYPNRALGKIFEKQLTGLGVHHEQGDPKKRIGSSDIGNVSQVVPTLHPSIQICDDFSCHTPQFAKAALTERAMKSMVLAAKALALTGLELISQPAHLKKIHEEFKKTHAKN
ncbi:MAG: M20 family metallopeptidase [Deltaproteobacteria bacterium]|nr:M20 family metallopeptidase [Deltaproteobacteria bacterium]